MSINRPSCKRNTNTQADMWVRRVKPVLTGDGGVDANTQYNAIIQFKTIQ